MLISGTACDLPADVTLRAVAGLCAPDGRPAPPLPPAECLISLALQHDVMALVAGALLTSRAGPLPDDLQEALEIYQADARIAGARAQSQLAEILRLFAVRGIPVMPFKGPALARSAYHDPELRPCNDLDLMVRPADVTPVLDLLLHAGFVHQPGLDEAGVAALRRYAGQYILFRDGALPVEPHWAPAPRTMAFEIDMESIWRRARVTEFAGVACLGPAPEDHFFLLALHGAKSEWHRLKWIADLPAFLAAHPGLDQPELRARAARWGCRRVVDLALLLSHQLFGYPAATPPADAATYELAGDVMRRLMMTAEAPGGPYTLTPFHWRLRERARDRLRYASRTLFTPRVPHYARLPLPPALRWVHVPLKLPWDHVITPSLRNGRRLGRFLRSLGEP